MYLTRLRLDPAHPQARRDLASAYEMHRTLARVFAPADATPPDRFLWRLEPVRPSELPALLVQAAAPGRWDIIKALAGYAPNIDPEKHVDTDHLVQPGRDYLFRLLANATVTRAGKRYGLRDEESLRGWIERQARQHGFGLLDVAICGQPRRSIQRRNSRAGRVVLDCALFEGRLRAEDAPALRSALIAGIGHGKAFGMGLLSLAPLRTSGSAELS